MTKIFMDVLIVGRELPENPLHRSSDPSISRRFIHQLRSKAKYIFAKQNRDNCAYDFGHTVLRLGGPH